MEDQEVFLKNLLKKKYLQSIIRVFKKYTCSTGATADEILDYARQMEIEIPTSNGSEIFEKILQKVSKSNENENIFEVKPGFYTLSYNKFIPKLKIEKPILPKPKVNF